MRKCSHCSHNGHNSRTCPNKGLKLFGVRLTDGIRKSASMGNLSHYVGSSGSATEGNEHGEGPDGYASEDFVPGSSSSCRDRKKGIPWTEEEHRMFLLGLQNLGKGDWKGISRSFVISRTPTQVASHAQKYFIRQSNASRRKRRSSVFDIVTDESSAVPQSLPAYDSEPCEDTLLPGSQSTEKECMLFDAVNPFDPNISLPPPVCYPVALPACFPLLGLFPLPFCSDNSAKTPAKEKHKIIRPTPVHLKAPLNIDELLGISKLSIGEPLKGRMPNFSLKLIGAQDRQSAFNMNLPSRSSDVDSISNAVPAT